MKLSELIEAAKSVLEQHGDHDVRLYIETDYNLHVDFYATDWARTTIKRKDFILIREPKHEVPVEDNG